MSSGLTIVVYLLERLRCSNINSIFDIGQECIKYDYNVTGHSIPIVERLL